MATDETREKSYRTTLTNWPGLSGSIDYTAKVPSSKLKGKDHIPTVKLKAKEVA